MICGYPDLYKYGSDSDDGSGVSVGYYSLMGGGNHPKDGRNPVYVDAYLRMAGTWILDVFAADDAGASLMAWYDYLVGTAPEEQDDVFTASIDFVDGEPVVTWTPDLNEGGLRHLRNYIVEGKTNLTDSAWHSPTNSSSRFFRVRVEMP